VSDQVFTLRRNPHFVGVDPRATRSRTGTSFTFFADAQALNLAAIARDLDMQERHVR